MYDSVRQINIILSAIWQASRYDHCQPKYRVPDQWDFHVVGLPIMCPQVWEMAQFNKILK
jgi:hypothetical protein